MTVLEKLLMPVGMQRIVDQGYDALRPRVHARAVSVAECESVFEVVIHARWRNAPVRVLQQAGAETLLLLADPTVESITRLGAVALEPSLFQVSAPTAEVSDIEGVTLEPSDGVESIAEARTRA